MAFEDDEPSRRKVQRAWKRLSVEARQRRYAEAERRRDLLNRIAGRVESGESERAVLLEIAAHTDRSTFLGWKRRFAKHGLEGLIDARVPPSRPKTPREVRETICTLRKSDSARPFRSPKQ